MTPARIILAALAALRLTRLTTTDDLGEWLYVARLKRWAARREVPADIHDELEKRLAQEIDRGETVANPPARWGWRSKLVKGLDCPFCVGFWIGAAVLLAELVTRRIPVLRGLWSFAAGALALNYVTGHVSKRIDG